MQAQATSRPKGIPRTWNGRQYRHTWTYKAADGAVLGHVARYDGEGGKDIVPFFLCDGDGWKAGAGPEPRPLFGLDTLTGKAVYVVEGEKCGAALHSFDVACVTSPGGSNAAHTADWTRLGAFGEVFILPDADTAGEKYARDVAGILARLPEPPKVHVCRLPGLPEGGDVVDWLHPRLGCEWDGYAPVPREPGDELNVELSDAIGECAEPVPEDWTAQDVEEDGMQHWEDPVPLDAAHVPPWPKDVFPEPVQHFVDALSASTETPPELATMMTLAALATAAQGKYQVRVKADYFEPVNLWTCCALPSGSRKTAVHVAVVKPLVNWEREERERIAPMIEQAQSERETLKRRIDELRKKAARASGPDFDVLQQEIYDAEERMPEIPAMPKLWTADCTPEKLAMLMQDNGESMAILADEGGIFDLIAGRYTSGIPNLDVFLQGQAGSPVRVDRGSRDPVDMDSPCLTMGICPQPDVVNKLSDKPGFKGRGLLARFLYALPESNLGHRTGEGPTMPGPVRQKYHDVVVGMLEHPLAQTGDGAACAHVLSLSQEAIAAWQQYARRVETALAEGGTFCHTTDWAGKLPGAVARLAGVLHVARHVDGRPWEHEVEAHTMDAALRLAGALEQHALIAFDAMGADPALDDARVLLGWIRREGLDTFTRRDAHHKHTSRFRRAQDLNAPLEVLAERHYIRQRPQPARRGRPSAVYDVNPAALRE